jgi:hypothetical protein
VEGGQLPGEPPHVIADIGTLGDQGGQPSIVGHPSHDQEVLAGLSVGSDHIGGPEVDVRCEATIELQLAPARFRAGLS